MLQASEPSAVVGADFGPDGRLYVLERTFSALGFRTRVRRFDLLGERDAGETLLRRGNGPVRQPRRHFAVWRDAAARSRLTLVSDDNFVAIQRDGVRRNILAAAD